jgi:1-acyl-sn-glycerol-3-phosphate acyltransferase
LLDLELLRNHRLATVPWLQVLVANAGLFFDYRIPRRTEIVVEGVENFPKDRGVFFAMNHTDAYNYWPFQYWMYRNHHRFTATWIKGKWVEKKLRGRFLLASNNIPVPSRGFVIAKNFQELTGRAPKEAEYRALRNLVDGPRDQDARVPPDVPTEVEAFVEKFSEGSGLVGFLSRFDSLFGAMMAEVIRLNREALDELALNVLVFPQGTRSKRLSKGHIGLAEMASHLGHAVVPVGCSGSDHLYPTSKPFSQGGRVIYRIGEPLELDSPPLAAHRVPSDVLPFSPQSRKYAPNYEAITRVVMDRIDGLLEPEYRYSEDGSSDGVSGVDRFL